MRTIFIKKRNNHFLSVIKTTETIGFLKENKFIEDDEKYVIDPPSIDNNIINDYGAYLVFDNDEVPSDIKVDIEVLKTLHYQTLISQRDSLLEILDRYHMKAFLENNIDLCQEILTDKNSLKTIEERIDLDTTNTIEELTHYIPVELILSYKDKYHL
jgi:hypothetical protein